MTRRATWVRIIGGLSIVATACSSSNSAAPTTTDAPVTTDAQVTTTASTLPASTTTTLPPTIDLTTLPGLLAVKADTCAPEPLPPYTEVPTPVICLLRPDGTEARQVSLPGSSPGTPAFTRDGGHLYYGDPYTKFGWIVDLATGVTRKRVRNEVLRAGVSPDQQWLLYYDEDLQGLAIARPDISPLPDGATSHLVAPDQKYYFDAGPTWAPDSTRFAYLSLNDGFGGELDCPEVWVGSIAGTPPVQITHFAAGPDGAEGCPDKVRWSPTADRLLLFMLGKPSYTVENLYAIDPDGSNLTALTDGAPNFDLNTSSYAIDGSSYAGDWSPDGNYIALVIGDGSAYHLYVMNAEGGQRTEISAAPLGLTVSLQTIRWALG